MPDMTYRQLVDKIHADLIERGCDLSPSDLGWAISTFLEAGLIVDHPTAENHPAQKLIRQIADECSAVTDE